MEKKVVLGLAWLTAICFVVGALVLTLAVVNLTTVHAMSRPIVGVDINQRELVMPIPQAYGGLIGPGSAIDLGWGQFAQVTLKPGVAHVSCVGTSGRFLDKFHPTAKIGPCWGQLVIYKTPLYGHVPLPESGKLSTVTVGGEEIKVWRGFLDREMEISIEK